ncbi:MAG: putative Ig domain-containing protein [Rubrobacteraceae bacterium]
MGLPGTPTAVDMTKNARERTTPGDRHLRTLIIMQGTGGASQPNQGSWEMAVPDGIYDVSVGVGDSDFFDGTDGINVEGEPVIPAFQRTASETHRTGARTVAVTDGRLTVSAAGTNTKINYVTIEANEAPEVAAPGDRSNVEGEQASLQVRATDPDGDMLTYGAAGLPQGLSMEPATGKISGTLASGSLAGSPYNVKITATDDGDPTLEGSASFVWTVEEPPDTTPPAPVTGFGAAAGDASVNLSWNNPSDADFAGVSVLRSATGHATDEEPAAGQDLVYEGNNASHADTALQNGVTYYYTVFARDTVGNWSGPVSAQAKPTAPPDTARPTIAGLRPKPDSRVRDRTPNIAAVVRDGAVNPSKSRIKLYLDGKSKTFSYDRSEGRISHASRKLSYGRHEVKMAAADAAENKAVETWSFRIVR